jgi:hypothetical protein
MANLILNKVFFKIINPFITIHISKSDFFRRCWCCHQKLYVMPSITIPPSVDERRQECCHLQKPAWCRENTDHWLNGRTGINRSTA